MTLFLFYNLADIQKILVVEVLNIHRMCLKTYFLVEVLYLLRVIGGRKWEMEVLM